MSDEWFFLQSLMNRQRVQEVKAAKEEKLSALRAEIKEALYNKRLLQKELDVIPRSARPGHPTRFKLIQVSSLYWALIAELREIEYSKSVIDKDA